MCNGWGEDWTESAQQLELNLGNKNTFSFSLLVLHCSGLTQPIMEGGETQLNWGKNWWKNLISIQATEIFPLLLISWLFSWPHNEQNMSSLFLNIYKGTPFSDIPIFPSFQYSTLFTCLTSATTICWGILIALVPSGQTYHSTFEATANSYSSVFSLMCCSISSISCDLERRWRLSDYRISVFPKFFTDCKALRPKRTTWRLQSLSWEYRQV